MPFPRETFPFTAKLIAGSPEEAGIYLLWQDGEIIYIGRAGGRGATIRSCLIDHFSGALGPCTRRSTEYSWEISRDPVGRELQVLEEYRVQFARLPRCNPA
jgi:hypothetical protein